jgi:quinol monooxygenase YgiN
LRLQEEVLDELEELADDPPESSGIRPYRMIRLGGDTVELVFLHLWVDSAAATITLLGVDTDRPSK